MLKIKHPEQFIQSEPTFNSGLRVSKSSELGLIGFFEVAFSFFLSNNILGPDRNPANLSLITRAFEMIFNIKFGDLSKKKEAIFSRAERNRTKALNQLIGFIEKEDDLLNS
jgi:hypothetical protein